MQRIDENLARASHLLNSKELAEFLNITESQVGWRIARKELAIPFLMLGPKTRRFRLGDVLLVTSGQRPAFKLPEDPQWESPYAQTRES